MKIELYIDGEWTDITSRVTFQDIDELVLPFGKRFTTRAEGTWTFDLTKEHGAVFERWFKEDKDDLPL